jgi:hypothetical protein
VSQGISGLASSPLGRSQQACRTRVIVGCDRDQRRFESEAALLTGEGAGAPSRTAPQGGDRAVVLACDARRAGRERPRPQLVDPVLGVIQHVERGPQSIVGLVRSIEVDQDVDQPQHPVGVERRRGERRSASDDGREVGEGRVEIPGSPTSMTQV